MVTAFASKGFAINPVLQSMYEGLKENFKSEAILPWGKTTYYRTTAPSTTGTFNQSGSQRGDAEWAANPDWKASLSEYPVGW